jgi:transposase InsO family protein
MAVVECYLTTEISYLSLAIKYEICDPAIIQSWVKIFKEQGVEGLSGMKGLPLIMKRKIEKSFKNSKPDVNNSKSECIKDMRIKELEEQVKYLQIENEFLKEKRRLIFQGSLEKEKTARIIHSLRRSFQLKDILAALNFPKSTYMYWQKRFDRENMDIEIEEKMLIIKKDHKDYGYRRIKIELKNMGFMVNKKKIQRIIRKLRIQVTSYSRRSKKYSSYKGKVGKVAKNRLNRRFDTNVVHQKISTDTTEFKYYEIDTKGKWQVKKLYLDPFMDLYNREIIAFEISMKPNAISILKALKNAIELTDDCKHRRTFHSDQGWAYQMLDYIKELEDNKIFQSMSRTGNCWDNAPMESFFGILKQEIYYGKIYHSFEELKAAIEEYIDYYNKERIKEKLDWMSPIEYRKAYALAS